MNKYIAIYVRRSVSDKEKGNNSLSIPAQIADCIRFVGEEAFYKVYEEDGKSGKDIKHRPAFRQMFEDCKEGLVSKIVVKKYDRFSRNMREYLNITDELDKLGVSVVSLCEPFNTDTKEGRMMRNNLLNFAEFEREAIAARVKDSYDTKAQETGFYQGGVVYFGYQSSRQTINGKTGSVLVPYDSAVTVRAMYDVYANPEASLRDVILYINENNLPMDAPKGDGTVTRGFDAPNIAAVLKNPLYVRADKNVYEYLLKNNYRIIDDVDAFDGKHGLFWHNYRSKTDRYVKVGYHEGLVDADVWLAVQDKFSHHQIPVRKGKVLRSWLAGMIRCGYCGHAVKVDYTHNPKSGNSWIYFTCSGYNSVRGCDSSRIKLKVKDVEQSVYTAMKSHIEEFEVAKKNESKPSTEEDRLKAEILKIDSETAKLMEKLADADEVLFGYIQDRIKVLHSNKTEYEKSLMLMERKIKKVNTKPLIEPLNRWDELAVEEKNQLAMLMIDKIYLSNEKGVEIRFSF